MKKYKKITAALIAAAMLISSAGCAGSNAPREKEDNTKETSVLTYRGTENIIDGKIKGEIRDIAYNNGKMYSVSLEYQYGEEDSPPLWHISSFNTDGSGFCSESVSADYISPIAFDSSGEPWIAEENYEENESEKLILKKIGADCSFTEEKDISAIKAELKSGRNYLTRIIFDGDNNIYTLFSEALGVSDSRGKTLFAAEIDSDGYFRFVKDSSGVPYLYKINYDGAFDLYAISTDQKQTEEKNSFSVNKGWYTTNILADGCGETDMYWCDMNSIYSYDIENNAADKIFTLSDAGIPSSAAEYIFPDGEGGFVFAGIDLRSGAPVITAVAQKEIPASENSRREITAAGLSYDISTETEYQIAEFNRTSDELKVSLTKFKEPEEFSADMLAGQLKDIIFSSNFNGIDVGNENLISKGIYADMGELIDNDGELSRSDFLPNILNAFERDGKLYTFTDSFQIQTALGKKSLIGDVQSMTFADIDRIAAGLPAGTELFPGNDKNNLLRYLMITSGNKFIDRNTGRCSFDSDEFVKLLEFADKYGLPSVDENYYNSFSFDEAFIEDHGVMLITYLSDFRDIYYYEHNMFMDELSAAGIPCKNGTGEAIVADTVFGINTSSGNSEDCWKFIRTLLTPEYQNYTSSFPVRKDSFEKKREEIISKTPNENEDYYLISFIGDMAYAVGINEPFTIEKSDVDKVADAVYAAKVQSFIDSSVTDIVLEEASAFFSGAKSAEDAAAMIQNRLSIYLSE